MKRLFLIFAAIIILGAIARHPAQAQGAMGPGYYDQDFFLFTYDGTWTLADSELCPDGDRYRADSAGAYVEFEIWGDGFTWYALATSGSTGLISVCIDSVCNSVSHYAGGAMVGLEFSHTDLGYGVHEIALVQNMNTFSVCGVLVHPPAPQPTLEPQEIEIHVTVDPLIAIIPTSQPQMQREPAYRTYYELPSASDAPNFIAIDNQVNLADFVIIFFLFALFFAIMRQATRLKRQPDE